MFLTVFGGPFRLSVLADPLENQIEFIGGKKGTTADTANFIEFYDEDNKLMGQIQISGVGEGGEFTETLLPDGNIINLTPFAEEYELQIHMWVEEGFKITTYQVNGGEEEYVPGDNNIYLPITSSAGIKINLNFEPEEGNHDGGGMIQQFPLLAYLEGVSDPVEVEDGILLLPKTWTHGTISFKAKICKNGDNIVPNDGDTVCDPGTEELSALNIEGINNRDSIARTVSGSSDRKTITVDKNFSNYGKAGIHLTNNDLNVVLILITHNLINIEAESPMRMDYSFGSSTIDQAIVTTAETGSLSIFFGNSETILSALGPNVKGISKLVGLEHVLQEDGSVKIMLPPLSKETVSKVTITIELNDGTKITRQINIIRTAIELSYNGESKTIRAGYVMHKAYLYNNLPHNDKIFDAYLQVIIYKDNIVVGYKQIQIDDEKFINDLGPNGSGRIDVYGDKSIEIYDCKIEGANKVSVFLTNGPIKYNSNTLPSIEFGLGAGVELEWGER